MFTPSSTYRVQLHKGFTFKDLLNIIDYLHALGISTIYAAPILKSTAGSIHGYDVTDPHAIDPEIGTKDDLRALAVKLKSKGMTWIQDIVPNHMAFDASNGRLMDVLERGPASNYYNYFDINWNHPNPGLKNKVMVPFLGQALETCIANNELKLIHTKYGFAISYFDAHYPVSNIAYEYLFSIIDTPGAVILRQEWDEFYSGRAIRSEYRTWQNLKSKWIQAVFMHHQESILEIITEINKDTEKMSTLLHQQHYVLTHWKQTEKEINYRRFFTVNQLICLRMEDDDVFNEYHTFLFALFQENLIQGLRIDHIDGLQDPERYIQKLRKLFGNACFIIAEKILEAKEAMPVGWQLQGTSGYEFLAYVNQLFTDKKGAKQLLEFYRSLVPELPSYSRLVLKNKKMMLQNYMQGEWNNLVHYFMELNLHGNFEFAKVKEALGLVMISLPVYRIYPQEIPLGANDLKIMQDTLEKAEQIDSGAAAVLVHFKTLFLSPTENVLASDILHFLKRLMQFTGPLTAKGVEDTTFYIYNPLISHDEVGDSPSTLGISIQEFHRRMESRLISSPRSLNASATHDTKRGEDVRIRLNLLSELGNEWQEAVSHWIDINKPFSSVVNHEKVPTVNDEYFIYQSIVGGFPEDAVVSDNWIKRLQEYLIKVVREAKVKSNWETPNEAYEGACTLFIERILTDQRNFLPSLVSFMNNILEAANAYTLGQVLIKITTPGIPDIYQGCELWDLSYVDPDNRRPVDYTQRKQHLDKIIQLEKRSVQSLFSFLAEHKTTAIEKLFVTWKSLNFRRSHEALFTEGTYIPLNEHGNKQIAAVYARHYKTEWVIVAVPFGIAKQIKDHVWHLSDEDVITLPEEFPHEWKNLFTGTSLTAKGHIPVRELFKDFSVALLYSIKK
jgi:(1->4)-alpha-D-glucan 1-alpha-D-glucosylmutase